MFPEDIHRLVLAEDGGLCDDALCDVFLVREVEHDVLHHALHDRAQATRAGVLAQGGSGDLAKGVGLENEVDFVGLHELPVLLDQRILGLGQNSYQGFFVELVEDDEDRKSSDEFRGQAEFDEILRREASELLRKGELFFDIEGRAEAEGVLAGFCGESRFRQKHRRR